MSSRSILPTRVTLRAFLMQWLHLSPKWFDAQPNPGNCDIYRIDPIRRNGYVYRTEDSKDNLSDVIV